MERFVVWAVLLLPVALLVAAAFSGFTGPHTAP
jgi:hypothetical protein